MADKLFDEKQMDQMMYGTFPDTGRTASGLGEQLDSVLGAPVRTAISEAQKGNFTKDAVKKIINSIHADPRNAPTGFDIAEQTGLENPYAKTAIATIADLASVPVPGGALGKLAGPMGSIEAKAAPKVAKIIKTLQDKPAAASIIKTLQAKAPEGKIIKTLQDKPDLGKIIRVGQQAAPAPGKIIRTMQQKPPEPKLIQTFTQPKYEGKIIRPSPSAQPATSARERAIQKVLAGAQVPVNMRQQVNDMLQKWQQTQIKAKLGLK